MGVTRVESRAFLPEERVSAGRAEGSEEGSHGLNWPDASESENIDPGRFRHEKETAEIYRSSKAAQVSLNHYIHVISCLINLYIITY